MNKLLVVIIGVLMFGGCKKESSDDNTTPPTFITLGYHVSSDAGLVQIGSTYRTVAPNEPVNGVVDISNTICSGGCGYEKSGTFQVISGHNYWFSAKTYYLAGGVQPHNKVAITYNGDTIATNFSGNDCSINSGTHVYYCNTCVSIAP